MSIESMSITLVPRHCVRDYAQCSSHHLHILNGIQVPRHLPRCHEWHCI